MAKPDYKFKPYTPVNLKPVVGAGVDDTEKSIASLQKQKENLDARLRAQGIDPDTGEGVDNRNLLEKALNLRPDQGVLMDFFEVINRPVETIKGAIAAGIDGENVLKGAWEGISGQEVITGSEFLEKTTGLSTESGVGKFVADVGIDIALDPLTYVPAGFFLKGLKKLTTRTIKETVTRSDDIMRATLRKLLKDNPIQEGETIVDVLRRVGQTDSDLVMFAGKTDDFVAQTYEQAGKYNSTIQGLEKRAEYIDNVIENTGGVFTVKGNQKKIYDYVQVENKLYKKYKEIIEAMDPNLKVVMTSTGNSQSDILILRKYSDDLYVKVGGLEAKKLAGSMAASATLEMTDAGIALSKNGFDFGETIGRTFKNLLKKPLKNGDTLEQALKKVYQTKGVGARGTNSLDIVKLLEKEPELLEEYQKLLFDMMEAKGIDTLFFATPGGRELVLSLDNAREFVGLKGGVMWSTSGGEKLEKSTFLDMIDNLANGKKVTGKGSQKLRELVRALDPDKTVPLEEIAKKLNNVDRESLYNTYQAGVNQFRLRPTLSLDDAQLQRIQEAGVALDTDEVVGRFATTTQDRTVGIIEYIAATRTGKVQEIARATDNFIKKFQSTFNLTFGFGAKEKAKMRQIMGESMFELERRSARLARIKEELIKINPKAGEYLGELIEAGAYIDDAGRIVTMKRRFGTSDFLDYVYSRITDDALITLPKFADDATRISFVKQLNKLADDYTTGIGDVFEVVERNGATILRFSGGLDDMNGLLRYVQEKSLTGGLADDLLYVNFGKARLSKESKNLLRTSPDLVKEYGRISDDILRELVEKAGFKNLPRELADQIGYMRHIMSKEAYAALQKQMPGALSQFAKPGRETLMKRTYLGSADEVNKAFKEFGNLDVNIFDPDAFNAMEDLIKVAQRKMEQHNMLELVLKGTDYQGKGLIRVIDNTVEARSGLGPLDKMFKDFREEFSALYKNLSPESKRAMDNYLKSMGATANSAVVMNQSAYNVLKNVEKAYVEIPQFVKMYDKFLNFWKGLTLVSPGFHMRNLFGNMFNSYSVGMDLASQSRYLTTAITELDEFAKIGKKLASGETITKAERELFDVVSGYFEHGVSQTHRGLRDLEKLKDTVDTVGEVGRVRQGYNNLLRFNFNAAEKMDDVQRYALYRWSLDKTGDASKAARSVSEALFDYSHLTPFEKDYMKRVFPFYTFMKNNFIFQAKNILANPKQYARVGRAYKYALEDLGGFTPEDLPDYTTENMWLPIPMTVNKNDKKAISFLKANLPLSDFTELVENPFKKGVISITAPIKLLIEFGAGRDLFTGAPLQAFPGERNAMQPGTGVLSGLRDERGNLTITQSPLMQKILNDIGLRTPINIASTGVDLVDTLTGYQGGSEGLGDFLARMGLVGVQEKDKLELTALYQDLERLRELKKYYEQETGNQLPYIE